MRTLQERKLKKTASDEAVKRLKEALQKKRSASAKPEKDGIRRLTLKDGESFARNLLKSDEKFNKERIWSYILGKTDPNAPKKTFVEQDSTKKAEDFIKRELNIDADYDTLPLDVANDCNQELIRAFNIFGTVGIVNGVKVDNARVKGRTFAAYDPKTFTILLRSDRNRADVAKAMRRAGKGYFSTRSHLHPYRHEIGHALWEYFAKIEGLFKERMLRAYSAYFKSSKKRHILLSKRASFDPSEMFSEAVAEFMDGKPRELSRMLLYKI